MSHHVANAIRATGGVLMAAKKSTTAVLEQQHHQQHHAPSSQHHNRQSGQQSAQQRIRTTNDTNAGAERDTAGPPANKRRKLSHPKATHTQTTLDHFTLPRPPTKVTVDEPHGQLVETTNGVRTELDLDEDDLLRPSPRPERIQRATRSPVPATAPTKDAPKTEDKRTLRSQDDGPRLKSELAIYFPNYEDIMFDVPIEEEFLTADTILYIRDDPPQSAKTNETPKSSKATANGRRTSTNPGLSTPQRPSNQFNGSSVLNLDFASNTLPAHPDDPLSDMHFFKSHRRAERKEKQLRNIERERAMHEKVQLERILDGLKGHDWLKVLGITGITDGEAKRYEAKRAYFIAEVQALVDKFKQWKEQEKKQRLEKEALIAAREAEEEEGETSEGSVEPPSSDLNASAARQLLHETANAVRAAASSTTIKVSNRGKGRADPNTSHPSTPSSRPRLTLHPPARPPSPERPFTSFYRARHLREAALGKSRHGRNVTAFGHAIPEMEEDEFQLPDDLLNPEILKVHARERRRRKRETAVTAAENDGK
ncbi:unnamed protein product [Zymoseptoria tritici ST99CH_1A5]|uniref:Something about silencing protein 4 domain-containing protein n=3 Tax=Zymoseptoria tritici TaxID=1047171 RepID=A0A1X7RVG2_ZYMT9|nr:unnamed protein product [Zymoseptoria tritici ST99CH_3D7]SMR53132.1 unnamed protein product [Zymoseptoria tritici ST99CH_1E4]SMY24875.1 unnamed protein product [Zymoseptoria tritici ST99CH_1A5]